MDGIKGSQNPSMVERSSHYPINPLAERGVSWGPMYQQFWHHIYLHPLGFGVW